MGGLEYVWYVGIDLFELVGVYFSGDKDYFGGASFDSFKIFDDVDEFEK